MTQEDLKFIEDMTVMINTPGWKSYHEEAEQQIEHLKEQLSVFGMPEPKVHWTQGYIACLRTIVSMEQRLELTLENAKEESDAAL